MTREKVQKQRRVWVQATRWVWQSGLISTRYRRDHHCRFHGQPKQGGMEGLSNPVWVNALQCRILEEKQPLAASETLETTLDNLFWGWIAAAEIIHLTWLFAFSSEMCKIMASFQSYPTATEEL